MKESRLTKIFVAGHQGMVGSALINKLQKSNDVELLLVNRKELDLSNLYAVKDWFMNNHPDQVYLAAAKVGGIHANNSYPAEFISQNLRIQLNVIEAAHQAGVNKLLFLGSSCIYPKLSDQPIKETSLLTGLLESTNEPYAIAKIAGIKLCESFNRQYGVDYRSVMPTNLYGPNDNFHLKNAHVIPALMRRFHEAKLNNNKKVDIWGSGDPLREFLYVDDMADACIHIMNVPKNKFYKEISSEMCSHINIGTGIEHSIRELSEIMAEVTNFQGKLNFNNDMPNGTPRKLLSTKRLTSLGWKSNVNLIDGLYLTYEWFKDNFRTIRSA